MIFYSNSKAQTFHTTLTFCSQSNTALSRGVINKFHEELISSQRLHVGPRDIAEVYTCTLSSGELAN